MCFCCVNMLHVTYRKAGKAFGKISTMEFIEVERLVAAFLGISE